MTMGDRIKTLRLEKGMTQEELGQVIGVQKSAIRKYESGHVENIKRSAIEKLAATFGVSPGYLMFGDRVSSENTPEIAAETVTFPVIGEIAAGYDLYAEQSYDTTDTVEIPVSYLKGKSKTDFLVLRVRGDSMYPMYLDKDVVLVERSDEKPESGKILAVRYEDFATIKKVEFDDAFENVRFIPINPMYPAKDLTNEEKEQFEFIGYPRLLVRDL